MAGADLRASRIVLVAVALASTACDQPVADECRSRYPHPTDQQIATDTTPIPELGALPVYLPADSLPQIFSADSAFGRYRNLYYADLAAFPGGEREVRRFLFRFEGRIVGKADTRAWYAVMIPDPGSDTANFRLLQTCIGTAHGVYVNSAYSREPRSLLGDTVKRVPAN